MISVKVEDLIGRKYEAGACTVSSGPLDCLGACKAVLLRLGMTEAAASLSDPLACNQDPTGHGWIALEGEPMQLGDVVLSEDDRELSVAVVCEADKKLVLTSHREAGVVCIPARRIPDVIGIYRWAG